jgi:hypothetical protein
VVDIYIGRPDRLDNALLDADRLLQAVLTATWELAAGRLTYSLNAPLRDSRT